MQCDICHIREAVVELHMSVNGQNSVQHLCTECAARQSLQIPGEESSGLLHLLSAFFGAATDDAVQETAQQDIACPRCGMLYSEFLEKRVFGCSDCYETFGLLVNDKVRKMQGGESHIGKHPRFQLPDRLTNAEENTAVSDDPIKLLQKRQKEAIAEENYEEAARLRDEIRRLQGGTNEMV